MIDFGFVSIKEMLLGLTQPWRKDNNFADRQYVELLKNTCQMSMPETFYSLKYDSYLLFTARVRYYCRLVNNETAQQLGKVKRLLDTDGSEQLAKYVLKIVRENIVTLIKDAVRQCNLFPIDAQWLTGEHADFVRYREEKEYLVILHYIIASLVRCWMEIQQAYCYVLDESEIYDVNSFYANVTGWLANPLVKIEAKIENGNSKKSKVTYCSFLYNNNDPDEWNISMQAFFNKLISYNLIAPNTDKAEFLNVFRGISTRAVITWIGKSNAPLRSIVSQSVKEGLLTVYPSTCGHWHVVSCRFVDEEGNHLPYLGSVKDNKGDTAMVKDIISALKG